MRPAASSASINHDEQTMNAPSPPASPSSLT
jgi:hypothetical protein